MNDIIHTPEKNPIKEKHKGKPFKNLSSSDKDELVFEMAKKAGLLPEDMEFE